MAQRAIPVVGARLFTRSFTALLVANVGFGYAFSSFFLLPKYMATALAAGPTDVGLVTAVHGLTVVICLPLLGAAVDRWGRREFLTVGALVMAASSLGYVWVGEVGGLLYALRSVQALAFAMTFAAGGALAVDLAPPERVGQAIGVYGLSFLAMNAVAPASVEAIAARAGWAPAFATAAAGALLCAVLSRRIREPRPAPDPDGNGDGLLAVATRPGTLRILAVIALVGSAMIAVFAFHQLYALELGIERVSDFFTCYAATAVTVRGGFGHLLDRWGHRRVAIVSLALYTVVVLGVAALEVVGLPLIGVGMGLAHGLFYPSFNAVAVATAVPGERGKLMALFQAAFQVGMSTGGLWGLLAARAGYPPVFEAAAAGLTIALLILLASPPGRSQSVRGT
jgi:predicted MFS family arabinose efflux permease